MKNCIAIITARGGSKRIPKKNIKNFLGQPIIKYSIDAAISSDCFDEVMVSTDDNEIAKIAKSFGANIPFMRSSATSTDHATTTDVLLEVLANYQDIGKEFRYFCCIYPTAPFINSEKLRNAYQKLSSSNAESLIPVVRYSFPILRSCRIEDGLVKMNWPEYTETRSQDLPAAFHDCGQFYFVSTRAFMQKKRLLMDFTIPYELPESEVQDIDDHGDWRLAEMKYSLICKK